MGEEEELSLNPHRALNRKPITEFKRFLLRAALIGYVQTGRRETEPIPVETVVFGE